MNFITKYVLKYLIARLMEASTWKGLVVLLAAWLASHGYIISDPQQQVLITWLLGTFGAIGTFLPDVLKKL